MSTRCVIRFGTLQNGKAITEACIYKHSDGYPNGGYGMLAGFAAFFDAVERDTFDTRFGDGIYLAAKYIVHCALSDREHNAEWRAERTAEAKKAGRTHKDGPLNFLGLGVTMLKHGDLEYEYLIDDVRRMDNGRGRPRVYWRSAARGAKWQAAKRFAVTSRQSDDFVRLGSFWATEAKEAIEAASWSVPEAKTRETRLRWIDTFVGAISEVP